MRKQRKENPHCRIIRQIKPTQGNPTSSFFLKKISNMEKQRKEAPSVFHENFLPFFSNRLKNSLNNFHVF
jgi:hypothetical protein